MKKKLIALVFFIFIFTLSIIIFRKSARQELTQEMLIMGTICRISIITGKDCSNTQASDALNKAFKLLKDYERRWNFYSKDSELVLINAKAQDQAVKLSPQTFEIISRGLEFSIRTDGVFDITATSLQQQGGHGNIVLNANDRTVTFSDKKTKIDLGGMATGYAIDRVVEFFDKNAVNDYLIDVGGDIYAKGKNQENQSWRIGVRDPKNKQLIIEDFTIEAEAVTTSGNYEKPHIIDPKTRILAKGDIESVTVKAQSCLDADVLATSFFIMGQDKTKSYIDKYDKNIQVLFIVNKNNKSEIIKYNWQKEM